MRDPKVVLDNLLSKSEEEGYRFQRLYRNLYNPDFYLMAYGKINANEGNMTKGTDGNTIDGMSLERIGALIERLKDESFQPAPSRRHYIKKPNGSNRPLGIPSVDDKLVQEVLRMILESIYEGKFSEFSHGFRPHHSCHTALSLIKVQFNGVRWFLEGDIKGFFDNIDHLILINILRKTIDDEKLINLIWKFLKAGYLEDWSFHKTYSGTPQGGIVSPILANIYLNELDSYIEEFKEKFNVGKKREGAKKYKQIKYVRATTKKRFSVMWGQLSNEERTEAVKEVKSLSKQMRSMQSSEPMDENYKRMHYVRYADDFIIGIIGSKEDAIRVKQDLTNFLDEKLKLELSQEKTLITHSMNKTRFLGYDIKVSRSNQPKKNINGCLVRSNYLKCHLHVPREKWVNKLLTLGALKIERSSAWESTHRAYLIHNDDLEIISTYNAEIRGLYNYYKLAHDVSQLKNFSHIMEYSMFKTFANKYKSSVSKINKKYRINGEFGIKYETKKGPNVRFFYNQGFKTFKDNPTKDPSVDQTPNTLVYKTRTSLIDRLLAGVCEWCGTTNVPLEMHHVRKLNNLKGKKLWEEFMIARRRKTVALCATGHGNNCHRKLHAGKLD